MSDILILSWFGWAAYIPLLIPLVLLVRLFVMRYRWSILRMFIVSLVGLVIASLLFHYSETVVASEPYALGGNLGANYSIVQEVTMSIET